MPNLPVDEGLKTKLPVVELKVRLLAPCVTVRAAERVPSVVYILGRVTAVPVVPSTVVLSVLVPNVFDTVCVMLVIAWYTGAPDAL